MIERLRKLSFTDQALFASVVASAALLAGAHLFEAFGYAPCTLCLDQREAHWTALAVAAAGLVAHFLFKSPLAAAAAVGATALVYAVSAGLAFFHAGVEFHYWPGPASCAGASSGATDVDDLTKALAQGAHGPACEEAAWRLLGVSMAGYNLIFSAGLFALTLMAALSAARSARRSRRPAAGQPTAEAS